MFKTRLAATALSAVVLASPAAAALTDEAAAIDAPFGTADFFDLDGYGDLALFDSPAVGQNFADPGDLTLTLLLGFDMADAYGTFDGSVDVYSGTDLVLTGLASSITALDSEVSIMLDGLSGDLADAFGTSALVSLFFYDGLGPDPLGALADGTGYDVAVTLVGQTSPIPLPAGVLLMASALGALTAVRRRRG